MSSDKKVDAQEIVNEMEKINDDAIWGFIIAYCRDLDYKGDNSRHQFIAYSGDILGSEFMLGFADLIEDTEPDDVELTTSDQYPHLTLAYDADRVKNAPPKSNKKYGDLDIIERDGQCVRCCRSTTDSIPPLTIRRQNGNSEWTNNFNEENVELCSGCSPAHYDDMCRAINAVCVEEDEVVGVEYGDGEFMKRDDQNRDRVLTDAMIKVLERDIL